MPVDPIKAGNAADLLKRQPAVDAMKAISTATENYDWARDYGVQALTQLAGTSPPDPTPIPPDPTPPAIGVIKIANDVEFDAAINKAVGGETLLLAPGNYSVNLMSKHFAKEVVVLGVDGVRFGSGGLLKDVWNLTFRTIAWRGGAKMSQGAWILRMENCRNLWFDNNDSAGIDSTGYAYYARTADNIGIRFTKGKVRSVSRGIVFYGGAGVQTEDIAFSKIGDDAIDYSALKPNGTMRNTIKRCSLRDAVINDESHRDFAQLIANIALDVIGNDLDAQSMGISDFGTAAQGAKPNQDLVVDQNSIVAQHVSTIRIQTEGSTGRVTNNAIKSVNGNKPLFQVPSTMKKSGNTIDGKPV